MFKLNIVILSALATGCAMSTEQQAAVQCGAAGAIGTTLLCKLNHGSNQDCAIAAGGVGLAASFGCYAWSKKLDQEHQALAGHENDLDRQLHYLKDVNATMAQNNNEMKRRIDTMSQRSAATATQVSMQSDRQEQLTADNKKLDSYIKENDNAIAFQRKTIADMRDLQTRTGSASPDLSDEIARAQANLAASLQLGKSLRGMRQDV